MFKKLELILIAGLVAYIMFLEVRVAELKSRVSDVKAKHDTCQNQLINTVKYNNELNQVLDKQTEFIKNLSEESIKKEEEYQKNKELSEEALNVMKQKANSCATLNSKIKAMGDIKYEGL